MPEPRNASTSTPAAPPTTSGDVLEHALALAISEAAKAGQWAIVSQLVRRVPNHNLWILYRFDAFEVRLVGVVRQPPNVRN
ncbi:MAG TPA: hypothetical protein PLR99_27670 [Polyangiaceae bacterium]|nr:hypothetical protein [Polyangiaceae bacterium]